MHCDYLNGYQDSPARVTSPTDVAAGVVTGA